VRVNQFPSPEQVAETIPRLTELVGASA
jgi:hypothetical protein